MAERKVIKNLEGARIYTSARLAPLSYVFGVVLLTLGIAWLFTMIMSVDSTVLKMLRAALSGLAGRGGFALPFLLIFSGVTLIVSAYHGVSIRSFVLLWMLYAVLLAFLTMATFVTGQGNLMEYVLMYNDQRLVNDPGSFSAYIARVYLWGADGRTQLGGGGALGMLIAYPAYRLFGVVGGLIFCGVFALILTLILARVNPAETFRRLSDAMERARVKRLNREQEGARPDKKKKEKEPPVQTLPMEEIRRGQRVEVQTSEEPAPWQPPVTQPAEPPMSAQRPTWNGEPMYQEQPAPAPVPPAPYQAQPYQEPPYQAPRNAQEPPYYAPTYAQNESEQAFYPVGDADALYDERFVLHPENGARPVPPPIAPVPSPAAPVMPKPARKTREDMPAPRQEPTPHQEPIQRQESTPRQEPVLRPEAAAHAEPTPRQEPALRRPENEAKAPAVVRAQTPPAFKPPVPTPVPTPAAEDDTPPWEDTEETAEEPELTDWQKQLMKKRRELEKASGLPPAPRERPAKQVFTDPVMPLSGERVSISGETRREDPRARLDGTLAPPKIQQIKFPMAMTYTQPPIRLLSEGKAELDKQEVMREDEERALKIEKTLSTFHVPAQIREIMHGPTVTRFALKIAEGIKVRQVMNVTENIALEMGTDRVRVESPIPGTSYVGIEVPNLHSGAVFIREVLDSEEMRKNASPTVVALGKDIAGKPVMCDLSKMPHLLIAGATGSGKSVCINTIVCSLLYRASPEKVRMILVDPKQVELQVYNGIPHLLIPVIYDPKKASAALNWVVNEMYERYGKISTKGVRNLAAYNAILSEGEEPLPSIVVVIDEMADLMESCGKDVEESIRRLAALARAAGIYMVLATQRPSVDVITGVIKNNIPSRIAFTVSSGVDSRTIIDTVGAEKLLGRGDMLYQPMGAPKPIRVQGCLVTDDEVTAITDFIKARNQADYNPDILEHIEADEARREDPMDDDGGVEQDSNLDDLLQEAIRIAVEDGQSSISMLQRRLRVGYARAGRLVDEMAKRGIISMSEGSKPRKTLITQEEYARMLDDMGSD